MTECATSSALGPGLGSPNRNGDREALLDKGPNFTPLRATGLKMLTGQAVRAVVFQGSIGINYGPLEGTLKGKNLGIVAFMVNTVWKLTGYSSSALPKISITIPAATSVCDGTLTRLTNAPAPASSSEPFDVVAKSEE